MRIVLVATGNPAEFHPLSEHYPQPLLPLVDRPIIQHFIETFVEMGVTTFSFLLHHLPEKMETFLGDGKRWGCSFTCHLIRDDRYPYSQINTLPFPDREFFLLGDTTSLADLQAFRTSLTEPSSSAEAFFSDAPDASPVWSGWALLNRAAVGNIDQDSDAAGFGKKLLESPCVTRRQIPAPQRIAGFPGLQEAQLALLDKRLPSFTISRQESEPGIWIGRNVSLHPTAHLHPPVYIGENSQVASGVNAGPGAVLAHDVFLDSDSCARRSLILPGSYVGEALELEDSIVDRNRLYNVKLGSSVHVTDNFILGCLTDRGIMNWVRSWIGRLFAGVLLLLVLPFFLPILLLLSLVRKGSLIHRHIAVRLPAGSDENLWRTHTIFSLLPPKSASPERTFSWFADFVLRVIPGLVLVLKGETHLVGVKTRSPEEIRLLSPDWQALYLQSKTGLITECLITYGPNPTPDEEYAAEAFYSVSSGFRHDATLFLTYIARILGYRK